MTNKISNIQKLEYLPVIKQELGKMSQRAIARKLNIGKTTLNRWSRELGFVYVKHTANEDFFNVLKEESSYLLGYIYADGNINWSIDKSYWALTITAAAKDLAHLEILRMLLSSTKPLLYSQKTNSYRLIVNSKKLCQKLMNLGVTPRKSLTITFPNLPKDQLRHFIRGIIDGDGSIFYHDRKRSPYFEVRIYSGSILFCENLVKCIESNFNIKTNVKKIGVNVYEARYTCTRGKKLASLIYSNSSIFLERKYLVYKNNVLEVLK